LALSSVTYHGEALLADLPFAIGKGPFQIKGIAYRGHIAYCDKHVPGGHRAVLESIGDEELRAFMTQPFFTGSSYDIFPLVLAAKSTAQVAECSVGTLLAARARAQVVDDLSGVYKLLLRLVSPEFVAKRFPSLISQYLDFGGAKVRVLSKRSALALQHGVPLPLADWYIGVTETYIAELLLHSGASTARVRYVAAEVDGESHGMPTLTLTCETSWTE
jgi:hypothetical protein